MGSPPMSTNTLATDDHQCKDARPFQAEDGLSHHGDPDTEEEVVVLEEPESRDSEGPSVLRVPWTPYTDRDR